ncbi:Death-associated protein kinase related [Gryllus bimaculatus]|nr:Death-associated protein kinase related [Gryllus bimaculatus]
MFTPEKCEGGELQTLLDRDIVPDEAQPQNLVLTGEFPHGDVKLCDLGISRYVGEGADVRDMLGTPDYVAPEVLNYEPISLATDMWSVGVLVYVLLTGCSPFGGDTKQETFCNISQCNLDFPEDLFEDVTEEAKDLMRKLMVKEPSKRLTVEQSLRHPWFSTTQVPTPLGAMREASTELSSKNSFREAECKSPVVSMKLEKSSPALSKKMDRPSPTMMRKPGKEIPELPCKNNDMPLSLPKRTVPVTCDVASRSQALIEVNKSIVTTTTTTVSEINTSKELLEGTESNMQDRSNGGMRSFRKNTFKKNMGSILERVTSCEDFKNNNGFNLTNGITNKNKSNDTSSTTGISNNSAIESNTHVTSNSIITSNISTDTISSNTSTSSNNTIHNSNTSTITTSTVTTPSSYSSNASNSINDNKNNNYNHEKVTHVSSISFNTRGNMTSSCSTSNGSTSNISHSSSTYGNNLCTSVTQPKTGSISANRALFESNRLSVRFSSSSKKVPVPETPAANSNASIASLTMSRPNRATAMQTMPLGGVREYRLKFELTSSSPSTTTTATTTTTAVRHSCTSTASRSTTATTTMTMSTAPSLPVAASVSVTPSTHPSSDIAGSQKNEDKDCVYTFRKCFIVDDAETENGNSLVSDGTNESETSSGYYDNSSCCSSSDSVSDVSETSTDSAGDRLSTASMDSLDSCYGKEKRHYSSTLTAFSLKNNYNKRVNSLKTETVSKTHQSPAFHRAVSTFNHISENSNKGFSQPEDVEQEKIFAAARRQAAKASHTTVINKAARASFVPTAPASPVVRKECALNITKERNGKEVVLQEVKAGKCSRFSEVKIESVQSRIKKFQS